MSDVTDSILLTVKKLNNVGFDYTAFDDDFVTYVNAALEDLHQLGVGPDEPFIIEDENDLWDDIGVPAVLLGRVKTYISLHVRLSFDPPATSFAIDMMKQQLEERATRLKWAQEDLDREEASL